MKLNINQIKLKFTLALILTLIVTGCGSQPNQQQATDELIDAGDNRTVVTKKLVSQTKSESISYQGLLEPAKVYQLSLQTGGVIDQLLVDKGQLVDQGQVLAILETDQLALALDRAATRVTQAEVQLAQVLAGPGEEQLDQAHARLAKVKLQLKEREQAYQRSEQLFGSGAIPRVEMERAENQYLLAQQDLLESQKQVEKLIGTPSANDVSLAELALKHAKIDLSEVQLMMKKTRLVAPESGIVLQNLVMEGQMIGGGQGIYFLGVIDPLHITLEIPLGESSQWQIGATASIKYLDKEAQGQVIRQASGQTGGTGMIETVVAVANPDKDWLVGEMVTVTGKGVEVTGHFVPGDAVLHQGEPIVAVLQDDGKIRHYQVQLGLPFGENLQVFGLQEGMLVVVEGAAGLNDGQLVSPAQGN